MGLCVSSHSGIAAIVLKHQAYFGRSVLLVAAVVRVRTASIGLDCLNTRSPVGGSAWADVGGVVLLREICY